MLPVIEKAYKEVLLCVTFCLFLWCCTGLLCVVCRCAMDTLCCFVALLLAGAEMLPSNARQAYCKSVISRMQVWNIFESKKVFTFLLYKKRKNIITPYYWSIYLSQQPSSLISISNSVLLTFEGHQRTQLLQYATIT